MRSAKVGGKVIIIYRRAFVQIAIIGAATIHITMNTESCRTNVLEKRIVMELMATTMMKRRPCLSS